jgi:predicted Zn-dependent peptidase
VTPTAAKGAAEPMETGKFETTELPSGLRILTERMPTVRSVTLGIWAGVGGL